MSLFDTTGQHPLGLHAGTTKKVPVIMRGGAGSRGQVVRFDTNATDGAVTASVNYGQESNPACNVLAATASHNGVQDLELFIYGILEDDIADDKQGYAFICGDVLALGGDTSAPGSSLSVGAGSELIAATDGSRIIGIARETLADGELKRVWFNGVEGFGFNPDVAP